MPKSGVTIAFGSCRKQYKPAPVLDAVARLRPDLWLWTGDYLYPDEGTSPTQNADHLKINHAQARLSKDEQRLRTVPLIDGVYDDHDFGQNDAGKNFRWKEAARSLFLDEVVEAPLDSPRRYRAGIYGSRTLGEPPSAVKVVMLDTRWSRDDHAVPSVGGSVWLPKPGWCAALVRAACAALGVGATAGDVLGEEQWAWLEQELRGSTASAHLIVSSIQVLTSSPVVESWGHFPSARERLLRLLAETRPAGAVLVSGDVHYAELAGTRAAPPSVRKPRRAASTVPPPGAELLEVTSSGLTHACGASRYSAVACAGMMRLFPRHRLSAAHFYTGINFGSAELRWPDDGSGGDDGGGGGGGGTGTARDTRQGCVALALGDETMLAVLADGRAYAWAADEPDPAPLALPPPLSAGVAVRAVSCADGHCAVATFPVPSLYLPCTFPVPSLYLPCTIQVRRRSLRRGDRVRPTTRVGQQRRGAARPRRLRRATRAVRGAAACRRARGLRRVFCRADIRAH
jgi:alkaline phosphatase D